jgi:hypothetical protein
MAKKRISAFTRMIESGALAKLRGDQRNFAADLARKIKVDYDLSYRSQVNIEASINSMLHFGMGFDDVKTIITDIFENLAFVNYVPTIVPGKGLTMVKFYVDEGTIHPMKELVRFNVDESAMRKEYDFKGAKKNKYAKRLKGEKK